MGELEKKKFTFADYITFIDWVYTRVIVAGIEFKQFYLAVITAKMFFDYDVFEDNEVKTNDEQLDYSKAWELLNQFYIFDNVSIIELFSVDYNIYEYFDKCDKNNLVYDNVSTEQFKNMIDVIDKKIDYYFNRDESTRELNQAFMGLIESIEGVIAKLDKVDIENALEMLGGIKSTFDNLDEKTIAKTIAKHSFEEGNK